MNPPNRRNAAIIIVAKRGDKDLQRRINIHFRRGNVSQDGLEERLEIRAKFGGISGLGTRGLGINYWEIGLLISGAQFDEKVKGLVKHAFGFSIFAVDLIDNNHGFMAHLQSFLEHETSLGHGAFGSIHKQQHTVHHVHYAFHLPAKIGVARGIYDIDFHRLAGNGVRNGNGGVLGQNGDAAFTLEVIRVHYALGHLLIVTKGVRLAQETIHQRGFAVVNVGYDGNVAKIGSFFQHSSAFNIQLSAIG